MNTIEGNKLIAEFMGCDFVHGFFATTNDDYFPDDWITHEPDELQYHTSWDWLMPVVQKIETLGYDVIIEASQCTIWSRDDAPVCVETDSKIKSTWQAIQKFIEWYNSEQSVKKSDTSKAT